MRGRIGYKAVEENFNPAMGFVNNAGIGDFTADLGYTHFFSAGIFQTAFAGVDLQRIDLLDGGLQSEVVNYRLLELETTQRDRLQLAYIANEEVVLDRFPIYRRSGEEVYIESGIYQFNEQSLNFRTAGQRQFSGALTYRSGDFFNGERLNLSGRLTWNQSRYFILSASYDWNDIQLPQGSFHHPTQQHQFSGGLFAYVVLDYTGAIRQHQRRDRNQHAIAVDSQSRSGRLYCAQLRAGRQGPQQQFPDRII